MNLNQLKEIVNSFDINTIPKEVFVEKSKGILIRKDYSPTIPNVDSLDILYDTTIERYEFYSGNLFYGSGYYKSSKYHLMDLFKSLELIK
jgi:hypothetical protein